MSSRQGQTQHRVLCGDATSREDTSRLLSGQQLPFLMVTDPPYGVDLEPEWRELAGLNPRTRQGGKVANDDRIDWSEAWALFPGNVVYVWHAGIHAAEVARVWKRADFRSDRKSSGGSSTLPSPAPHTTGNMNPAFMRCAEARPGIGAAVANRRPCGRSRT